MCYGCTEQHWRNDPEFSWLHPAIKEEYTHLTELAQFDFHRKLDIEDRFTNEYYLLAQICFLKKALKDGNLKYVKLPPYCGWSGMSASGLTNE